MKNNFSSTIDLEKLRKIQEEMAKKVVVKGEFKAKYVLGVDQAFVGDLVISACVVVEKETMSKLHEVVHSEITKMPYIPTYLMFREGSSAVNAVKLAIEESGVKKSELCVLVDGSGIAHPRKCGLATYIGLELNVQSVGVTKKKLYGDVKLPKNVLESEPIYSNSSIIGYAVKTCKRCNPIYVSPGHLISPEEALKAVVECLRGYKLPEPIRFAHNLASNAKVKVKVRANEANEERTNQVKKESKIRQNGQNKQSKQSKLKI